MLEPKLNWKPDLPDFRDFKFHHHFLSAPSQPKPPVVDLRPLNPPIYNQGAIGSCTAQSWCRLLEFIELRDLEDTLPDGPTVFHQEYTPMSRLYLYYNERELLGSTGSDSGARLRDGMKSLKRWGICEEHDWEYKPDNLFTKPNQNCYDVGLKHTITAGYRISDGSLELMKTCLIQGFPFVFGISIYSSFKDSKVANSGIIPMPRPGDRLLGGHAITGVGYDDTKSALICANSWGEEWGDKGYFYLPYAYASNPDLACDFWTAR